MKPIIKILVLALLAIEMSFAQAPDGLSYQSVIRDSNSDLVVNSNVGVRFALLQGSVSGTEVFAETHIEPTNDNGLLTLEIGDGTAVTSDISSVDWANGPYFAQVEVDPNGGTAYSLSTVSELLSVPYALHAGNGLPDANDDETLRRTASGWVADDNITNTGSFIGLGSGASPIGAGSVTLNQSTSSFGGMYINTTGATGRPFIGFAGNGTSGTWIERNGGNNNDLQFNNSGVKLSIRRNSDAVHMHNSKLTSDDTGDSVSLLPIAHGHIDGKGSGNATIKFATDNVTVEKSFVSIPGFGGGFLDGTYELFVTGEAINENDYSIIVTLTNVNGGDGGPRLIESSVFDDRYVIKTRDIAGIRINSDFSFVIYKN